MVIKATFTKGGDFRGIEIRSPIIAKILAWHLAVTTWRVRRAGRHNDWGWPTLLERL